MKIFNSQQTKEADLFTIENEPITSIELMERASFSASNYIIDIYGYDKDFTIVAGPGNNGADGLAIARILKTDFDISPNLKVYIISLSDNQCENFKINYNKLLEIGVEPQIIKSKLDFYEFNSNEIIIDTIFGSGLTRKIEGFAADVIEKMNNSNCQIVAIDIPSGLFTEDNIPENQVIVKANHTLTFEFPFLSFFFPENEKYVGHFHVLSIDILEEIKQKIETNYFYTEHDCNFLTIKQRPLFSHKGNYGHGLLIAGSYGKAGAGILAAKACNETGIGLLTAHVPKCNYEIMQISSPETMLDIDFNVKYVGHLHLLPTYNSIAIGPGLGINNETEKLFIKLLKTSKVPLIIDADAITILAKNQTWFDFIPKNSILTPHIKEFERLTGKSNSDFQRNKLQIEFSKKYSVYIILKGRFTAITSPEGNCYFNSTGNPGMATGGSGDVLTGILLSLSAQNYESLNTCILGVYLHGLAGDLACLEKGENCITASDIINFITKSFLKINKEFSKKVFNYCNFAD